MKYVLDASVAVASLRPNEPLHAAAVAFLSPFLKGRDALVIPAIFRIREIHQRAAGRCQVVGP
jgi:predicted nucleic acid-binding protein